METKGLNRWAAEYIGERDEEIRSSEENEWYTRSFGAAAVVMHKAMIDGKDVKISIGGTSVDTAEGIIAAVRGLYDA